MIVVACLQRAESSLRDGDMRCPQCRGRLRPYGHARTRTVPTPLSTVVSTPPPTLLAQALNLLAGAALRYRERFGLTDPAWALIGAFSYGYLLAPPMIM